MKRGFQLLKTRDTSDIIDFTALEHRFKFPEKYLLFAQTFLIGDNSMFSEEYENLEYNQLRTLLICVYEPMRDICFTGFNTIEEVLTLKEEIEEYKDSKFLPIGFSSYNAGIVVSTEGDDKDVIYFDDPESEMIKVSDDIFEFVKGLVLEFNKPKSDYTNLYKNWGEDFWRVREGSPASASVPLVTANKVKSKKQNE